ncbi:hypothetical protein [Devosia sp. 2618]|uniref:hypothetical protein n=1 Tax=Devosia sp. 2618 TaxID=3156454 RepID=UPI003395AE9B
MTLHQWAIAELETRRWELSTPDMHVARRKRRQAMGLSKREADQLVADAEIDRRIAA